MNSVYWRHLPDGRYEVGFSDGEQCEPMNVVADKEAARSWVRTHRLSFEEQAEDRNGDSKEIAKIWDKIAALRAGDLEEPDQN
jgi:hypothetical protein